MELSGVRRLLKTDCHETANQYLRFGWKLINQQMVDDGKITAAQKTAALSPVLDFLKNHVKSLPQGLWRCPQLILMSYPQECDDVMLERGT